MSQDNEEFDWRQDIEFEDEEADEAPLVVRSSTLNNNTNNKSNRKNKNMKPFEVSSSTTTTTTTTTTTMSNTKPKERSRLKFISTFLLLFSILSSGLYYYFQQQNRKGGGGGNNDNNPFSSTNNNNNNEKNLDVYNSCRKSAMEHLFTQVSASSISFCQEPDVNTETLSSEQQQQQQQQQETNCKCDNPTEPQPRTRNKSDLWNSTFDRNQGVATAAGKFDEDYDVIFFGDSITEHWQGTEMGFPVEQWQEINTIFRQEFTKSGGGRIDGLALGISGDRCGQLLYRIRNGELPDTLDAKVFWILIGVNDLSLDQCSTEAVVAGNIRIVKELLAVRPNSKIVINSILPYQTLENNNENESDNDDNNNDKNNGNVENLLENKKWQIASKVNHLLECYAKVTKNVDFFNATSIFVTENQMYTKPKFFVDAVHPSYIGSKAWASEIVDTVYNNYL